jgi:hypoxanthine phosphoribosyltransferase
LVHNDVESILLSRERIAARVGELADDIRRAYAGEDLLLVGVLKGAFMLMADLARELADDNGDVRPEFDFMAVSSYGSATQSSGVVRILKDLDRDIAGRHVLLVEDILDSGLTLQYLVRNLQARGPASLAVLTLLSKPNPDRPEVEVYEGFSIPDVFVVGYGLDYADRYRQLPYVGVLRPGVYQRT